MKKLVGPFKMHELKRLAANLMPPLQAAWSGELLMSVNSGAIGAVSMGGRVSDVWMSVGASGKDDTNSLGVQADVLINDVTCLTTNPFINHVSGEESTQKTTRITGETGIAQAVIDPDANSFAPGDIISASLTLTRTASPTTEIENPVVVVELEPNIL